MLSWWPVNSLRESLCWRVIDTLCSNSRNRRIWLTFKVKVKVKVYSLASSAKRHSPNFTHLPPDPRTCSFISHLSSPGSIQPGCHFRRTELFKHTSLHCPTRYPLTPGSRECTCGQSALPRSTTLEHIQRSWGSNIIIWFEDVRLKLDVIKADLSGAHTLTERSKSDWLNVRSNHDQLSVQYPLFVKHHHRTNGNTTSKIS